MGHPIKIYWACPWGTSLSPCLFFSSIWINHLTFFLCNLWQRFMNYCLGKLQSSPWSELDGLQPETKIIDEKLANINLKGFLTINSQPAVNGEKSDSPTVGKWKVFLNILRVNQHSDTSFLTYNVLIHISYCCILWDWLLNTWSNYHLTLLSMKTSRPSSVVVIKFLLS